MKLRWTPAMVDELIKARGEHRWSWEEVAKRLDFPVTAKQCANKFSKLHKTPQQLEHQAERDRKAYRAKRLEWSLALVEHLERIVGRNGEEEINVGEEIDWPKVAAELCEKGDMQVTAKQCKKQWKLMLADSQSRGTRTWTVLQSKQLLRVLKEQRTMEIDWVEVANALDFTATPLECKQRAKRLNYDAKLRTKVELAPKAKDKATYLFGGAKRETVSNKKNRAWTLRDLKELRDVVQQGAEEEDWDAVVSSLTFTASAEQCKLKWQAVLGADLFWTLEEENKLVVAHKVWGNSDFGDADNNNQDEEEGAWHCIAQYVGTQKSALECKHRIEFLRQFLPQRYTDLHTEFELKQLTCSAYNMFSREMFPQFHYIQPVAEAWNKLDAKQRQKYEKEALQHRIHLLTKREKLKLCPKPKFARFA